MEYEHCSLYLRRKPKLFLLKVFCFYEWTTTRLNILLDWHPRPYLTEWKKITKKRKKKKETKVYQPPSTMLYYGQNINVAFQYNMYIRILSNHNNVSIRLDNKDINCVMYNVSCACNLMFFFFFLMFSDIKIVYNSYTNYHTHIIITICIFFSVIT